jgi:cyclopropane fatty-acyl-phospholipid synthase-like methyltransferase
VFNPLTVYWCHRADDSLACVVAEVHNTYRQRHAYLVPGVLATVPKQFYVYWDAYFAALDRYLAPGGRIGLQTITMAHDRMLATRHTYTWIQKYIFPGGLLPSVTAIQDSLAPTRLRITGREDFGAHYLCYSEAGFRAGYIDVSQLTLARP